jgi:hypothetical protein
LKASQRTGQVLVDFLRITRESVRGRARRL